LIIWYLFNSVRRLSAEERSKRGWFEELRGAIDRAFFDDRRSDCWPNGQLHHWW
jgi:hypothetical protein